MDTLFDRLMAEESHIKNATGAPSDAPPLELNYKGDGSKVSPALKNEAAFIGGINDALVGLPDNAVNVLMIAGEMSGLIDRPKDPENNRNVLHRFFSQNSYAAKRKLIESIPEGLEKKLPYLAAFNRIGTGERLPPTTWEHRVLGGAGEAAGAGAGMATAVGGLSRAGVDVAKKFGTELSETFLKSQGKNQSLLSQTKGHISQTAGDMIAGGKEAPIAAVATDVLANMAGGALGTAEEELFGVRTGVGDLAGSTAPYSLRYTPAAMALRLGAKAVSKLPGAEKVKDEVLAQLNPKLLTGKNERLINERIQAAIKVAEENGDWDTHVQLNKMLEERGIPQLNLTMAEKTKNKNLLEAQNKIQASMTPAEAAADEARRRANAKSMQDLIDNDFKDNNQSTSYVVRGAKDSIDRNYSDIDTDLMNDSAQLAERNKAALPDLDGKAGDTMNEIRGGIEAKKKEVKELMDAKAKEANIDGIGPRRGIQGLKERLEEQFFQNNTVLQEYVPPIIRKIVGQSDKTMTFGEWRDFDQILGHELGKAIEHKNAPASTALTKFREEFRKWGNEAFVDNTGRLDRWKEDYEATYMPFEKGSVHKALTPSVDSRPNDMRYRTHDEELANTFWQTRDDAKDFLKVTETLPELRQSMNNVILDAARDYAMPKNRNSPYGGGLDPNRLEEFIKQHRLALDEHGITEKLQSVADWNAAAMARQESLLARKTAIQKEELTKVLGKYEKGEFSPEEVIEKALGSSTYMAQLKSRVMNNDPELADSLKEAVVTHLRQQEPDFFTDPKAYDRIMKRYGNSLRNVLEPETLNNVRLLVEGNEMILSADKNLAGAANLGVKSLPEKFADMFGTSIRSAGSQFREMKSGRNSPHNVAVNIFSRLWAQRSAKNAEAVMKKALISPDFAKELTYPTDSTGKVHGGIERHIKAVLFDMGIHPDGIEYEGPMSETDPEQFKQLTGGPVRTTAPQTVPSPAPAPAPVSAPPPPAPAGLPAPPPAAPYNALFPNDAIGGAIAASRGYAKGGSVKGDRLPFADDTRELFYRLNKRWGDSPDPTSEIEDRRGEPPPSDIDMEQAMAKRAWLMDLIARSYNERRGYADGGTVMDPELVPKTSGEWEKLKKGIQNTSVYKGMEDQWKFMEMPGRMLQGEQIPYDEVVDSARGFAVDKAAKGVARAMFAKPSPDVDIGIFAGRRAAKADPIARQEADMRLNFMGQAPEDVLKKTGWFQRADDNWRFEIDDSKATLNHAKLPKNDTETTTLGEVFNHPELFEQYPHLKDVKITSVSKADMNKGRLGWAHAGENTIAIPQPFINAKTGKVSNAGQLQNVLLHEIQHFVQNHEGFPNGSSAAGVMQNIARNAESEIADLKSKYKAGDISKEEFYQKVDALTNAFTRYTELPPEAQAQLQHGLYKRDMGEAEARMVQARELMGARERRENMPWGEHEFGFDMPESKVIIPQGYARGGLVSLRRGS